jgi:hypothetical protein
MVKSIRKTRPSARKRSVTKKNKSDGRIRGISTVYSSKIIKAGALLPDTKALLSYWDASRSVSDNLTRVRDQNLLGKASRSRVEDILKIFRQRYLSEDGVIGALIHFVKNLRDGNTLDRILYFHATQADSLLRDVVIELLARQWSQGILEVDTGEIESALKKWVDEGKTAGTWGDYTVRRVTQGVLSALRDFGVLHGSVKKRIAPVYLPVHAFCYIAFYLKENEPSGSKVVALPHWKLFFLSHEGVERFLLEAHQQDLLEYRVAGSVTRLTFSASTLEEYANVLTP